MSKQQSAGDKRVFWIVVVCCLLLTVLIVTSKLPKTKSAVRHITVGKSASLQVDIADSESKREQGYSGHVPITDAEGMLFTFPYPTIQTFWMNKMLFDLDFIYVRNGSVVYLVEHVKAPVHNDGQIEYITSPVPFDGVLEVKSGFIQRHSINLGDKIRFEN